MARLDADLLLLAFRTAHYTDDPLNKEARQELSDQSHEVANSIRDEIDVRVERALRERGIQ